MRDHSDSEFVTDMRTANQIAMEGLSKALDDASLASYERRDILNAMRDISASEKPQTTATRMEKALDATVRIVTSWTFYLMVTGVIGALAKRKK